MNRETFDRLFVIGWLLVAAFFLVMLFSELTKSSVPVPVEELPPPPGERPRVMSETI